MAEEENRNKIDPFDQVEAQYRSNLADIVGYYKWMATLAAAVLALTACAANLITPPVSARWLFLLGWLLLAVSIYANLYVINRLLELSGIWSTPKEIRSPAQELKLRQRDSMARYAVVQQWALYLGGAMVLLALAANLYD